MKTIVLFLALALSASAAVIESPLSYLTATLVKPGGLSNALATCTNGSTLLLVGSGETVRGRGNEAPGGSRNSDLSLLGKTNVTIVGLANYLVRATNFGNVFYVQACSNVTFRNFSIDSHRDQTIHTTSDDNSGCIWLGTNAQILIEGMSFLGAQQQAVTSLVYGSPNTRVFNCFFQNIGNTNFNAGIHHGGCVSGISSGWQVIGCRFENNILPIELEGVTSPEVIRANNVFSGNTILGAVQWAITVEVERSSNCFNNVISANVIEFNTNGLADPFSLTGSSQGILIRGLENSTIANNTIRNAARGIQAVTSPGRDANVKGLTIAANVIHRAYIGIAVGNAGGSANVVRGINVVGNTFTACKDDIQVSGDTVTIQGNTMVTPWLEARYGGGNLSPVTVSATSGGASQVTSNVIITGNVSWGPDDSTHGPTIAAGCKNVWLENNLWGGLPSTSFTALYNSAGDGLITTYLASTNHDFASTAAGASATIAVSCPGATTNFFATVAAPNQFWSTANSSQVALSAWASNEVVYVRLANNNLVSAFDPAGIQYKITARNHPR